MSFFSIKLPINNQLFNHLYNRWETIAVFILLIAYFDANIEAFKDVFNFVSYIILVILVIFRWKRCFYVATKDTSLLILIGITLLSYFWSAAPEYTLDETKTILRSSLLGVYLAAQYHPKELVKLFTKMFALVLLLNIIYIIFAFATGQTNIIISDANNEPSWTGFLTHKQYFGRMMMHIAIIFLLSLLNKIKNRWIFAIGFGASIVLLYLSQSKTSWIGFLVALILLPVLKFARLHYKSRTIVYVTSILITGIFIVVSFTNYEAIVVDILHKPPNFNGRFEIWELAMKLGLEKPLLGYGYSGFWTSDVGLSVIKSTWASSAVSSTNSRFHSHNGFIDLFLQLGFIGLSLFIFNFLAVIKRLINIIHSTKSIESFWMLEFIVISFILQGTETLTLFSSHAISIIYISIAFSTILWQKRIKYDALK
jgi:exopolysaccharide production protein ExoQ